MRGKWAAATILSLAIHGAAVAQPETAKLAVQIDASTPDPIGRQMVFYLRDAIGKSGSFYEVQPGFAKGFKLMIVTLDPYQRTSTAGTSSIYSFVILGNGGPSALDSYFNSYVGSCVTPQTCAQTLFAALGVVGH